MPDNRKPLQYGAFPVCRNYTVRAFSCIALDIVESAKIAKANGAFIISLTNIGTSPLSKVSDVSLFTVSNEAKYRIVALSSRIAQMAIIDSIYTVIACNYPAVTDNFRQIERALDVKKY